MYIFTKYDFQLIWNSFKKQISPILRIVFLVQLIIIFISIKHTLTYFIDTFYYLNKTKYQLK